MVCRLPFCTSIEKSLLDKSVVLELIITCMKWYKKQIDKLKAAKVSQSDEDASLKKTGKYEIDERKKWVTKKKFPNPVAASKLNRPKTDSL